MKITILLFGILKDIIGKNSFDLVLHDGAIISELKEVLIKNYDKLNNYSNFSIAVNEEYVNSTHILKPNDVVALIPPVSGG